MAVKAMQKGKIQDYDSFKNEINILMGLVSYLLSYEEIVFSTFWLFISFHICRFLSELFTL